MNNKQLLVALYRFHPYKMPAVEQNISSAAGELLLTKHPTVQFFIPAPDIIYAKQLYHGALVSGDHAVYEGDDDS